MSQITNNQPSAPNAEWSSCRTMTVSITWPTRGIKTIIRNNKLLNKQPRFPDIFLSPSCYKLFQMYSRLLKQLTIILYAKHCVCFNVCIFVPTRNTNEESGTLQMVSRSRCALKKKSGYSSVLYPLLCFLAG